MRILKYTIKKIQVFFACYPFPLYPRFSHSRGRRTFFTLPPLSPFCGYPANLMPLKCPPLWASKGFSEFS